MTITGTKPQASAQQQFDRAVTHHLAGRTADAIAAYREALETDPRLAQAMNNLGALLGSTGKSAEALELFRRAVAVDARYAEARNNLGIALAGAGRHADAVVEFDAALALEPTRAAWWNNLGNSCVECFGTAPSI